MSRSRIRGCGNHNPPFQLQLTKPNADRLVVVSGWAELDVLRFFHISEAQLCRFVEALDNVIEVFVEYRFSKALCQKYWSRAIWIWKMWHTFQEKAGVDANKDGTMKMTLTCACQLIATEAKETIAHWGAAISSYVSFAVFRFRLYTLISMVPPPASTITTPSPFYRNTPSGRHPHPTRES